MEGLLLLGVFTIKWRVCYYWVFVIKRSVCYESECSLLNGVFVFKRIVLY